MTLTLPDAAVAARDPSLPGLALVLDADGMAEALRHLLPEAGIAAVRPTYLRYKPETSCLAGFSAATALGPVDLAAKAMKPRRYAIERMRPLPEGLRSPLGPVALTLDQQAILVRIVPYDRELRSLPRLVDPTRRQALLARLVPDLATCRWAPLRHKPGRRHIGRLVDAGTARAVVKLYAPDDFPQARLGARFAARLGEVALLGASDRHGILASAWQPGRTLAELDPHDPRTLPAAAAAATSLARVHAARPVDLPPTTLEAEAEIVQTTARAIAALTPELADRAARLADRIASQILEKHERLVPLHGDFSADQVVVRQGDVRLIDWDRASLGPRALDLGSFIARLEADARQTGRDCPKALIEAFKTAYEEAAGERPRGTRIWTAAALFRLAVEPFRARHTDWPELTRAILGRVEHHLERVRHRSAARRKIPA